MTRLIFDIESRSELNLKVVGLDNYARHKSTQITLLSWVLDEKKVNLCRLYQDPLPKEFDAALKDPTITKLAWNCQFERTMLAKVLGIWIPYEQWFDIMVQARYWSLPGSLEKCGEALGLPTELAKIKDGSRLIRKFCEPFSMDGEETLFGVTEPEFHDWKSDPEDWAKFEEYCVRDTEAERTLLTIMEKMPLPQDELETWWLDQKINDAGLPVNMKFVENGLRMAQKSKDELQALQIKRTGLENPNSRDQLLPWAQARGYPFNSLRKDFVRSALAETPGMACAEVLKTRLEASKTTYKKLERMKELVGPDNRIRHQYLFMGAARTARWSGSGFQPQNFYRPTKEVEKTYQRAVDLILAGDYDSIKRLYSSVMDTIASCTRSAIQAPEGYELVVNDLSAIENRVVGWLAGCDAILKVFRDGLDPYVSFACKMYNLPYEVLIHDKEKRQIAKPPVLGCGYGLGPGVKKIISRETGELIWEVVEKQDEYGNTVRTGLMGYAENMGIKLTPEQAYKAWEIFRRSYPEVVTFWKDLEQAGLKVLKSGGKVRVGFVTFDRKKRKDGTQILRILLPSGRHIHYLNARIEARKHFKDGEEYEKDAILYDGIGHGVGKIAKGWGAAYMYGGKFCLAEDTQVVTQLGLISIQNVSSEHWLWDGLDWVTHGGLVFKGEKKTISWMGLTATPNHQILAGKKWHELEKTKGYIGLTSQLTGHASEARRLFFQLQEMLGEPGYSVIVKQCLKLLHAKFGEDRLALAPPVPAREALRKATPDTLLSPTIGSGLCGCIEGRELYPDVTTPFATPTKTMGGEELEYTSLGEKILWSFCNTLSLCQDTITPIWTWIESTMMETTNPETSDWLAEKIIVTTAEILSTLNTTAEKYATQIFGKSLSQSGVTTPYSIILKTKETQNGSSRDTGVQKVYDLINAGPRNRFTVMTKQGPLVVHNCENITQAIARDILVHGMKKSDKLGFELVGHAHDEIITVVEKGPFSPDLAMLRDAMNKVPVWAPGLPLASDGYVSQYYRK